jgi:predicted DNA-binding transcriptional regulator AlpA
MNNDLSNNNETARSENPPAPQRLWTTPEVAEYLHVSIKTIFNLRKKALPFVYLGGAVRFVPQEITDYLANSKRLAFHRSRQIIRKRKPPHD